MHSFRKEVDMIKTFVRKMGIICIIVATTFIGILILSSIPFFSGIITKLTSSQDYRLDYMGPNEIVPEILKVKENDGTTRLFIGDSVACGIWNEIDKPVDSTFACTNRAITLAGQYAIMRAYTNSHSGVKDIYLVIINDSFDSYFDYQTGCQYAVMPFVLTDTINMYSEDTIDDIEKTYGGFCLNKNFIHILSESPLNLKLYLNCMKQFSHYKEKDKYKLSKEYLEKMIQYCDEENIDLHILMGPMADTDERRKQTEELKKEFRDSLFLQYHPDFFDSVSYYPPEMFRDGIHFSKETLKSDTINIVKQIELNNHDNMHILNGEIYE